MISQPPLRRRRAMALWVISGELMAMRPFSVVRYHGRWPLKQSFVQGKNLAARSSSPDEHCLMGPEAKSWLFSSDQSEFP